MKEFFKYVAATVVGLIIYGIIQTIMFVSCISQQPADGLVNQVMLMMKQYVSDCEAIINLPLAHESHA